MYCQFKCSSVRQFHISLNGNYIIMWKCLWCRCPAFLSNGNCQRGSKRAQMCPFASRRGNFILNHLTRANEHLHVHTIVGPSKSLAKFKLKHSVPCRRRQPARCAAPRSWQTWRVSSGCPARTYTLHDQLPMGSGNYNLSCSVLFPMADSVARSPPWKYWCGWPCSSYHEGIDMPYELPAVSDGSVMLQIDFVTSRYYMVISQK